MLDSILISDGRKLVIKNKVLGAAEDPLSSL